VFSFKFKNLLARLQKRAGFYQTSADVMDQSLLPFLNGTDQNIGKSMSLLFEKRNQQNGNNEKDNHCFEKASLPRMRTFPIRLFGREGNLAVFVYLLEF